MLFSGIVTSIISACTKDVKLPDPINAPLPQPIPNPLINPTLTVGDTEEVDSPLLPIKKLNFTNLFPVKVFSGDQLKVTWLAEFITSISIQLKYGNGSWQTLASSINPSLGEYTIVFPNLFTQPGPVTISMIGDNIVKQSPEIEKWNIFIVDANIETELLVIGAIKSFNFNSMDVFVKRESANSIKCFSSLCTHAGCPISFLQSSNKFNCSCHGSQFDSNGNVLMGPASDPLNTYVCETIGSEKFRILY